MAQRITRSSWSIEPHSAWSATDDPECLTLTRVNGSVAFQLSSAVKEIGNITQAEILEFASEKSDIMGEASPVELIYFNGYEVAYTKNGSYLRRYWLAHSNTLIFATYIGTALNWASHASEIRQMLNSLRVNR